jgi:hypothetical protein
MVAVLVKLPDLPVMVTVDVPIDAVDGISSVSVALEGVVPVLKDPTTPVDRPEIVTVTVLPKPFCGVKVRVLVAAAPRGTLRVLGEADNVNVGGKVTVSATVVLLVRAPELPAIVTVAVAAAAVLAAVKVTVVWPPLMAPKLAMTPEGNPEAASAIALLKPFKAVMAMALVTVAPALRLTLAGVAETVKLAGAATVIAIVVLLVMVPDSPVTVTMEVPSAAPAAAFNVSVVLRVAAAGLKVAVTPVGRPLTEKVTVPLKPVCGATVMVLAALPP